MHRGELEGIQKVNTFQKVVQHLEEKSSRNLSLLPLHPLDVVEESFLGALDGDVDGEVLEEETLTDGEVEVGNGGDVLVLGLEEGMELVVERGELVSVALEVDFFAQKAFGEFVPSVVVVKKLRQIHAIIHI